MDEAPGTANSPMRRKTTKPPLPHSPLASDRLDSLPTEFEAMIRHSVARIEAWTPKGIYFGWERAFKNKGKFPTEMSKADARSLVCRSLLENYPKPHAPGGA